MDTDRLPLSGASKFAFVVPVICNWSYRCNGESNVNAPDNLYLPVECRPALSALTTAHQRFLFGQGSRFMGGLAGAVMLPI